MDQFSITNQNGENVVPTPLGQEKKESYTGDFVHESQSMATESKFNNVSQLWLDTCKSYDQALEDLSEGARFSKDVTKKAAAWEAIVDVKADFSATPYLAFRDWDTGEVYTPTNYAMGQLSRWLHLSKGTVRDALEPVYGDKENMNMLWDVDHDAVQGLANVINTRLRKLKDPSGNPREFLFRLWTDDNTIRSVQSTKYARIDNRWFIEKLSKLIPDGKLSHWRGDRDNIYGNVLIPHTIRVEDDSDYGGMMSVGNSEIGMRRLSATPSVFRSICMNGCIWDQEIGYSLSVRHVGNVDLERLEDMLTYNLNAQIPLLGSNIEHMLSLRDRTVSGIPMQNVFAAVGKELSLTKSDFSGLFKAYNVENDILAGKANNAFGVTQALTRYGQTLDNEGWVRFDELGGRMVTMQEGRWDAVVKRAGTYSDKELEKLLGPAALAIAI
jgi:hypothetical protein